MTDVNDSMHLAGDLNPPIARGGATRPSVVERADRMVQNVAVGLMQLHRDVYQAYRVAGRQVRDETLAGRLAELETEHAHSLRELEHWARAHDLAPPDRGDIRVVLTVGRVWLGRLRGTAGVLAALAANEQTVNTAYEKALARRGLPRDLRELLVAGLLRERQHRERIGASA